MYVSYYYFYYIIFYTIKVAILRRTVDPNVFKRDHK